MEIEEGGGVFRGIILFVVGLRWFEGNFGDFNRIMFYVFVGIVNLSLGKCSNKLCIKFYLK